MLNSHSTVSDVARTVARTEEEEEEDEERRGWGVGVWIP